MTQSPPNSITTSSSKGDQDHVTSTHQLLAECSPECPGNHVKKPPKQLSQSEREYWRKRMPNGFQFYLERLARAVIRNQPKNILDFCAIYMEELLVHRNAELSCLPEAPYFQKLYKTRVKSPASWQPWTSKTSPTTHYTPSTPMDLSLEPDLVVLENLPDTSCSPEKKLCCLETANELCEHGGVVNPAVEVKTPTSLPLPSQYGAQSLSAVTDLVSDKLTSNGSVMPEHSTELERNYEQSILKDDKFEETGLIEDGLGKSGPYISTKKDSSLETELHGECSPDMLNDECNLVGSAGEKLSNSESCSENSSHNDPPGEKLNNENGLSEIDFQEDTNVKENSLQSLPELFRMLNRVDKVYLTAQQENDFENVDNTTLQTKSEKPGASVPTEEKDRIQGVEGLYSNLFCHIHSLEHHTKYYQNGPSLDESAVQCSLCRSRRKELNAILGEEITGSVQTKASSEADAIQEQVKKNIEENTVPIRYNGTSSESKDKSLEGEGHDDSHTKHKINPLLMPSDDAIMEQPLVSERHENQNETVPKAEVVILINGVPNEASDSAIVYNDGMAKITKESEVPSNKTVDSTAGHMERQQSSADDCKMSHTAGNIDKEDSQEQISTKLCLTKNEDHDQREDTMCCDDRPRDSNNYFYRRPKATDEYFDVFPASDDVVMHGPLFDHAAICDGQSSIHSEDVESDSYFLSYRSVPGTQLEESREKSLDDVVKELIPSVEVASLTGLKYKEDFRKSSDMCCSPNDPDTDNSQTDRHAENEGTHLQFSESEKDHTTFNGSKAVGNQVLPGNQKDELPERGSFDIEQNVHEILEYIPMVKKEIIEGEKDLAHKSDNLESKVNVEDGDTVIEEIRQEKSHVSNEHDSDPLSSEDDNMVPSQNSDQELKGSDNSTSGDLRAIKGKNARVALKTARAYVIQLERMVTEFESVIDQQRSRQQKDHTVATEIKSQLSSPNVQYTTLSGQTGPEVEASPINLNSDQNAEQLEQSIEDLSQIEYTVPQIADSPLNPTFPGVQNLDDENTESVDEEEAMTTLVGNSSNNNVSSKESHKFTHQETIECANTDMLGSHFHRNNMNANNNGDHHNERRGSPPPSLYKHNLKTPLRRETNRPGEKFVREPSHYVAVKSPKTNLSETGCGDTDQNCCSSCRYREYDRAKTFTGAGDRFSTKTTSSEKTKRSPGQTFLQFSRSKRDMKHVSSETSIDKYVLEGGSWDTQDTQSIDRFGRINKHMMHLNKHFPILIQTCAQQADWSEVPDQTRRLSLMKPANNLLIQSNYVQENPTLDRQREYNLVKAKRNFFLTRANEGDRYRRVVCKKDPHGSDKSQKKCLIVEKGYTSNESNIQSFHGEYHIEPSSDSHLGGFDKTNMKEIMENVTLLIDTDSMGMYGDTRRNSSTHWRGKTKSEMPTKNYEKYVSSKRLGKNRNASNSYMPINSFQDIPLSYLDCTSLNVNNNSSPDDKAPSQEELTKDDEDHLQTEDDVMADAGKVNNSSPDDKVPSQEELAKDDEEILQTEDNDMADAGNAENSSPNDKAPSQEELVNDDENQLQTDHDDMADWRKAFLNRSTPGSNTNIPIDAREESELFNACDAAGSPERPTTSMVTGKAAESLENAAMADPDNDTIDQADSGTPKRPVESKKSGNISKNLSYVVTAGFNKDTMSQEFGGAPAEKCLGCCQYPYTGQGDAQVEAETQVRVSDICRSREVQTGLEDKGLKAPKYPKGDCYELCQVPAWNIIEDPAEPVSFQCQVEACDIGVVNYSQTGYSLLETLPIEPGTVRQVHKPRRYKQGNVSDSELPYNGMGTVYELMDTDTQVGAGDICDDVEAQTGVSLAGGDPLPLVKEYNISPTLKKQTDNEDSIAKSHRCHITDGCEEPFSEASEKVSKGIDFQAQVEVFDINACMPAQTGSSLMQLKPFPGWPTVNLDNSHATDQTPDTTYNDMTFNQQFMPNTVNPESFGAAYTSVLNEDKDAAAEGEGQDDNATQRNHEEGEFTSVPKHRSSLSFNEGHPFDGTNEKFDSHDDTKIVDEEANIPSLEDIPSASEYSEHDNNKDNFQFNSPVADGDENQPNDQNMAPEQQAVRDYEETGELTNVPTHKTPLNYKEGQPFDGTDAKFDSQAVLKEAANDDEENRDLSDEEPDRTGGPNEFADLNANLARNRSSPVVGTVKIHSGRLRWDKDQASDWESVENRRKPGKWVDDHGPSMGSSDYDDGSGNSAVDQTDIAKSTDDLTSSWESTENRREGDKWSENKGRSGGPTEFDAERVAVDRGGIPKSKDDQTRSWESKENPEDARKLTMDVSQSVGSTENDDGSRNVALDQSGIVKSKADPTNILESTEIQRQSEITDTDDHSKNVAIKQSGSVKSIDGRKSSQKSKENGRTDGKVEEARRRSGVPTDYEVGSGNTRNDQNGIAESIDAQKSSQKSTDNGRIDGKLAQNLGQSGGLTDSNDDPGNVAVNQTGIVKSIDGQKGIHKVTGNEGKFGKSAEDRSPSAVLTDHDVGSGNVINNQTGVVKSSKAQENSQKSTDNGRNVGPFAKSQRRSGELTYYNNGNGNVAVEQSDMMKSIETEKSIQESSENGRKVGKFAENRGPSGGNTGTHDERGNVAVDQSGMMKSNDGKAGLTVEQRGIRKSIDTQEESNETRGNTGKWVEENVIDNKHNVVDETNTTFAQNKSQKSMGNHTRSVNGAEDQSRSERTSKKDDGEGNITVSQTGTAKMIDVQKSSQKSIEIKINPSGRSTDNGERSGNSGLDTTGASKQTDAKKSSLNSIENKRPTGKGVDDRDPKGLTTDNDGNSENVEIHQTLASKSNGAQKISRKSMEHQRQSGKVAEYRGRSASSTENDESNGKVAVNQSGISKSAEIQQIRRKSTENRKSIENRRQTDQSAEDRDATGTDERNGNVAVNQTGTVTFMDVQKAGQKSLENRPQTGERRRSSISAVSDEGHGVATGQTGISKSMDVRKVSRKSMENIRKTEKRAENRRRSLSSTETNESSENGSANPSSTTKSDGAQKIRRKSMEIRRPIEEGAENRGQPESSTDNDNIVKSGIVDQTGNTESIDAEKEGKNKMKNLKQAGKLTEDGGASGSPMDYDDESRNEAADHTGASNSVDVVKSGQKSTGNRSQPRQRSNSRGQVGSPMDNNGIRKISVDQIGFTKPKDVPRRLSAAEAYRKPTISVNAGTSRDNKRLSVDLKAEKTSVKTNAQEQRTVDKDLEPTVEKATHHEAYKRKRQHKQANTIGTQTVDAKTSARMAKQERFRSGK